MKVRALSQIQLYLVAKHQINMSNIYNVKTDDIKDFVSYHNTNKLIMFYKQNCLSCKVELKDIKKLSELYKDNIEYAICDIQGKSKFCIKNKIINVPTIQIYKNRKLYKQIESRQTYDLLKEEIESI